MTMALEKYVRLTRKIIFFRKIIKTISLRWFFGFNLKQTLLELNKHIFSI
jgi:hypothetical protein